MSDLQTNLRLNDSQFREGLRAADGALGRFDNRLKSMGRTSEAIGKALKLGGLASIVTSVVSGFDQMIDRQSRLIDGSASFRDKWEESQGSLYDIAGMIPFIGESIQRVSFHLQDGTAAIAKMAGNEGLARIRKEQDAQLKQLNARTKQEKELLRIEDEHIKRIEAIGREAAKSGAQAKDMYEREKQILEAQKKSADQFRIIQAGSVAGTFQQFSQNFGATGGTGRAAPVTAPGPSSLPQPGPTSPPAAIKAQEDTAKTAKDIWHILSRLDSKLGGGSRFS